MCASHCMHGNYFYDNSVNILHVALLSTISIAIPCCLPIVACFCIQL